MTRKISTKLMLSIAKEASSLVGLEIKKQALLRPIGKEIGSIGKGGDLSKRGDLLAEKVVIKYLSGLVKRNVVDKIILVSEESGVMKFVSSKNKQPKSSIFIILDPVDGSNNMRPWLTPKAFVGCSLALGNCSRLDKDSTISAVEVGWVRDIFYDLDYYAVVKQGAFFISADQNKPLKLKTGMASNLSESIIAVSLDKTSEKFDKIFFKLRSVLKQKKCQRRVGSTVLDLSKVACGEFDAFISVSGSVKIHDIAATKLIIQEAGGYFHFKQVRGLNATDYLNKLLIGKKENLIQNVGFEIIATGTKKLFNQIKRNLK